MAGVFFLMTCVPLSAGVCQERSIGFAGEGTVRRAHKSGGRDRADGAFHAAGAEWHREPPLAGPAHEGWPMTSSCVIEYHTQLWKQN